MKTGERIRLARVSERMTQTQLAKTLKMYQSTVARWESDKEAPSIDSLEKLSKVFNKPVDFWISSNRAFRLEDKLAGTLDNGARILNVLSNLPPTLPDYTKEDIGGTVKVSKNMFGYAGDYCVHLDDDTMEPKISRGSSCIIHTDTMPHENAIMLVYLPNQGYVIRQLEKQHGGWVFKALNPKYKPIVTNNYRVVGRVIGTYQHI